jgi:hypothetical protein
MVKSRRMRWAGHLARMKAYRTAYWLLMGKPDGKGQYEYHEICEWIILKWIRLE